MGIKDQLPPYNIFQGEIPQMHTLINYLPTVSFTIGSWFYIVL